MKVNSLKKFKDLIRSGFEKMRTAPRRAASRRSKRASSLITTLLVLAILSTIVVAFMQSMSIERNISRSLANRFRVELMADAGLAVLSKIIANATQSDGFLVLRSSANNSFDDYIGQAKSNGVTEDGEAVMFPLFTHSQSVLALTNQIKFSSNSSTNQNKLVPVKKFERAGAEMTDATATWVTLTDSKGREIGRFAYWAEDFSSRINAAVAANADGPGGTHRRGLGLNPQEIPIFPLFDKKSHSDPGTPQVSQIVSERQSFLTQQSLSQIPGMTSNQLIHLSLFRTGHQEVDVIPYGFGYRDEGKPKYDLNFLVLNRDLNGIINVIKNNLPNFAELRRGAMPGDDYLANIAASIIDYADSDSEPTSGPNFRGIDAFPFINEIYDHCTASWPSSPGQGGNYHVTVRINPYVELWNPSNQPFSGELQFEYDLSGQRVMVNGSPRALSTINVTMSVSIPPNGFEVISLGNQSFTFPWGPTPPPANANMPMPAPNPFVKMNLFFGGKLIDTQPGGLRRSNANTGIARTGGNVNHWRGNAIPPSDYSVGQTADPRNSFYNQAFWFNHTYSGADGNTSWKGRGILRDEANRPFNQQKVSAWPDGGTDTLPGRRAANSAQVPTAAAAGGPQNEPDKSPSFISNAGSYLSIMELGNIFDPGQHKIDNPRNGQPVDISSNQTASNQTASDQTASDKAGGGITLAVGRREFSKFDTPGSRASQLLDLFTVTPNRATDGLININTATRETLRALAVGLVMNNSTTINSTQYGYLNPAKIEPPTKEDAADLVAEAIINSRPFFSTSQLNLCSTNSKGKSANWKDKFFGNPQAWPKDGPSVRQLASEGADFTTITSGWNDRAAESLLARIYNLVTVRSRVFRVLVAAESYLLNNVGEVVKDRAGSPRVVSSCQKEYVLYAKPRRKQNGEIESTEIVILYEKTL